MLTYLINTPEDKTQVEAVESKGKKRNNNKSVESEMTEPESEKEKVVYDSVKIEIYDAREKLIRTLAFKAPEDNGIQRTYWNMDEKGINWPSRKVPKANSPEPGGIKVIPGSYKAVFSYGDQKDSTSIKVVFDPRVTVAQSTHEAIYAERKKLENAIAKASKATHRLAESKSILEDYEKRMNAKNKETFKSLLEKTKAAKDSIEQLFIPFLGENNEGKQGIIGSIELSITNRFGAASRYLGSLLSKPGATELRMYDQAVNKLDEHLIKIDAFYSGQWKEIRIALENADLSPFKDYDPLK